MCFSREVESAAAVCGPRASRQCLSARCVCSQKCGAAIVVGPGMRNAKQQQQPANPAQCIKSCSWCCHEQLFNECLPCSGVREFGVMQMDLEYSVLPEVGQQPGRKLSMPPHVLVGADPAGLASSCSHLVFLPIRLCVHAKFGNCATVTQLSQKESPKVVPSLLAFRSTSTKPILLVAALYLGLRQQLSSI